MAETPAFMKLARQFMPKLIGFYRHPHVTGTGSAAVRSNLKGLVKALTIALLSTEIRTNDHTASNDESFLNNMKAYTMQ